MWLNILKDKIYLFIAYTTHSLLFIQKIEAALSGSFLWFPVKIYN